MPIKWTAHKTKTRGAGGEPLYMIAFDNLTKDEAGECLVLLHRLQQAREKTDDVHQR